MLSIKPNDLIIRKDKETFSNGKLVATVERTEGDRLWLLETKAWVRIDKVKSVGKRFKDLSTEDQVEMFKGFVYKVPIQRFNTDTAGWVATRELFPEPESVYRSVKERTVLRTLCTGEQGAAYLSYASNPSADYEVALVYLGEDLQRIDIVRKVK